MGDGMLIGTWAGACLLLPVLAGCARRLTTGWQQVAMRIIGSWIAASSILALALRLVR
jgi:hypothetical protein